MSKYQYQHLQEEMGESEVSYHRLEDENKEEYHIDIKNAEEESKEGSEERNDRSVGSFLKKAASYTARNVAFGVCGIIGLAFSPIVSLFLCCRGREENRENNYFLSRNGENMIDKALHVCVVDDVKETNSSHLVCTVLCFSPAMVGGIASGILLYSQSPAALLLFFAPCVPAGILASCSLLDQRFRYSSYELKGNVNDKGQTLFHLAAIDCCDKNLKLLLKNPHLRSNINKIDERGCTALDYALIRKVDLEIMCSLMDKGAVLVKRSFDSNDERIGSPHFQKAIKKSKEAQEKMLSNTIENIPVLKDMNIPSDMIKTIISFNSLSDIGKSKEDKDAKQSRQ